MTLTTGIVKNLPSPTTHKEVVLGSGDTVDRYKFDVTAVLFTGEVYKGTVEAKHAAHAYQEFSIQYLPFENRSQVRTTMVNVV